MRSVVKHTLDFLKSQLKCLDHTGEVMQYIFSNVWRFLEEKEVCLIVLNVHL